MEQAKSSISAILKEGKAKFRQGLVQETIQHYE